MSDNPTKVYNDYIRANLPIGMEYNTGVDRYQVNNHSFFKYKNSNWYYKYVSKFGYSAASVYFVNGFEPALVLDFTADYFRTSGTDTTFDSAITHAATTNATMVDSDGLLKWRPHNLLLNSDFTGWTQSGGSITTGQADPDGGTSAATVDSTLAIENASVVAGNTYRLEVAVKAGTAGKVTVGSNAFSTNTYVAFDLSTVAVISTGSGWSNAAITSLGASWYLISADMLPLDTELTAIYLRTDGAVGSDDGTADFYAPRLYRSDLGGMVNNPDRGDSYVPTTTAARYLPRRGHHVYNGTSWVNEGLLHESDARTNLILNSETLEQKEVYVTPQQYTLSFNSGSQFKSEIMGDIATNAVDVFVYDTSKDSDGGAWRTGTLAQASSWYNETLNTATRGARREFPAVAVIVAEVGTVTIYDGDDPALPMWAIYEKSGEGLNSHSWFRSGVQAVKVVCAFDGKIYWGSEDDLEYVSGLHGVDLVADFAFRYADRVTAGGYGLDASSGSKGALDNRFSVAIVNGTVNDIAVTVLPNAPIDAATGLPVPTIAVGTAGGVSVIKDDGTVVNSAYTGAAGFVLFDDLFLYYSAGFSVIEIAQLTAGFPQILYNRGTAPPFDEDQSYPSDLVKSNGGVAVGLSRWNNERDGLHFVAPLTAPLNGTRDPKTMFGKVTSTYNTGWMNGDIKGAFLSDTDDTDLVGGELVTNGTFDSDLTGWTSLVNATWDAGEINCADGAFVQAGVFTGSKTVRLSWDQTVNSGTRSRVRLRSATGSTDVGPFSYYNGTGPQSIEFSTTNGLSIWFYVQSGTDINFDNISVVELDADRSVNNKPLNINGTITRSPVATGADLVAYSGFSASNYLEQPYNSDLDFGTGDFCILFWNVFGNGSNEVILSRMDAGLAGSGFGIGVAATGALEFSSYASGALTNRRGDTIQNRGRRFIAVVREGGVLKFYVEGELTYTVSDTTDYDNANAALRIGCRVDGASIADSQKISLLRISATAPTAEQIAKIYNDEKVLFQENAQATLYGTSDAVKALAHDDDTGLLHVGTSAGRSVFDGLRRVDNTTDAITTAISAVGGFIAEE